MGGLQLSAWMVPPVGVCFSDQPDSHLGWGREVMAGLPELYFPRKDRLKDCSMWVTLALEGPLIFTAGT